MCAWYLYYEFHFLHENRIATKNTKCNIPRIKILLTVLAFFLDPCWHKGSLILDGVATEPLDAAYKTGTSNVHKICSGKIDI